MSSSKPLSFGVLEIYHNDEDKTLGVGSYGKVCLAKYGQLPCAAKLLHETMFESGDSGRFKFAERFEQECQFLSKIKHPNIVQYLGTSKDSKSHRLALLMELMQESLTRYLKRSHEVPYHTQLNICHDVALALSYLHSNAIIHRDLSSNNVLLIGEGSKAKVSDFGMSKLIDANPHMTPLTQCPGTTVYMPPEALTTPPSYSNKLDCFSLGVLTIQIITRMFPTPGDATTTIEDKRYPTGRVVVFVPEAERRKSDIEIIKSTHPLLPLLHHCLKDRETERPSADQVCQKLEGLKTESEFKKSLELTEKQTEKIMQLEVKLDSLNKVLESNFSQLEAKGMQLDSNKDEMWKNRLILQQKDAEIATLKATIKGLEMRVLSNIKSQLLEAKQEFQQQLKGSINGCASKIPEDMPTTPNLPTSPSSLLPSQPSSFTWKRDTADLPIGTFGANGVYFEDRLYIGGGDCKDLNDERVVCEYDINGTVRKWTLLPAAPVVYFAMAAVRGMLVLVGGMEMEKRMATNQIHCWDKDLQRWVKTLPPMQSARQDCMVVSHQKWLLVAGGSNNKKPISSVELFDSETAQWIAASPLPKPSTGMTSCVIGNTCYFMGGTNFIEPGRGEAGPKEYVFSLQLDESIASNKWNQLPNTPFYCSTAVPFGEYVMAVGGTDSLVSGVYNACMFLYSPLSEKWVYVGNMPSSRSHVACVVLSHGCMAVIGGQQRGSRYSRLLEVLHC